MPIRRSFYLEIILPTTLTLALLVVAIFVVILPFVEQSLLEKKKELIREEVATAFSVLEDLHRRNQAGEIPVEQAREEALERLRTLRYGPEFKDYFWVTDMVPAMLMHPFRPDLEGKDLTAFHDATGKLLFMDMLKTIRAQGEGFADYMWQWKDDADRIGPKLSFVRQFEPWGWVVGTGVYVNDVRQEIGRITRRVLWVLVVTMVLVGLGLGYVMHRSLRIERERSAYEQGLRASRERYRALLESTTEGVVLFQHGRAVYANRTLFQMLGYDEVDFAALEPGQLFADVSPETGVAHRFFMDMLAGREHPPQFEAVLRRKDGSLLDVALLCSPIGLGEGAGTAMLVRDITAHKTIAERFDESVRRFHFLAENVNVGVLRLSVGRGGRIVEANAAARELLGVDGEEALVGLPLEGVFKTLPREGDLLAGILETGSVKGRILTYVSPGGEEKVISLSAMAVQDEHGAAVSVNIVLEDLTARAQVDQAQTQLIAELQTSLQFLNLPLGSLGLPLPTIEADASIGEAATRMVRAESSLLAVTTADGQIKGVVTEGDMQRKVVAQGLSLDAPLWQIMTPDIISLPTSAMVFEAILLMGEKGIRHLVLTDAQGAPAGVLGAAELLQSQRYSLAYMMQAIKKASSPEALFQIRPMLRAMLMALVEADANPRTTTRILVTVSESITQACIHMAVERLGPPPVAFEFLSMGSQGRLEQTIKTDQDNAIIFADVAPERLEEVQRYFLQLGALVCGWLDKAGYNYCEGGIMAKNPAWCQPLAAWKLLFAHWVDESTPQNLLNTKIFFDFRRVSGSGGLTEELAAFLDAQLEGNSIFFYNLTQNCLLFKPPLGLFKSLRTESDGAGAEGVSLKKAMTPVVDFARVYALRHGIRATNTLERLGLLQQGGHLTESTCQELEHAYVSLMRLRLQAQVRAIRRTGGPDNLVDPKTLSHLDRVLLKEIFSQIALAQKKMSLDFTGGA